jgi:hypothetical protein
MKKIFILITAVILFSCPEVITPHPPLNPPDWILGTWSDFSDTNVYTFETDDVIFSANLPGTSVSVSFGSVNEKGDKDNGYFDSAPNSTTYRIEVRNSFLSDTYEFVQTSPTTLQYTLSSVGTPLELTKD